MKKKTLINILFLAIILFPFSEILFSFNVIFGYVIKIFTSLVLLISFFYFIFKIVILKDVKVLKTSVMLCVYALYICLRYFDDYPIFGVTILINFGASFFVYYIARHNMLNSSDLKYFYSKYVYISLFIFFISYYFNGLDSGDSVMDVGPSYLILPIFMYLIYFYWNHPKKMLLYYLVILFITAYAGKRTVFFIGLLGLLIYFYYFRVPYSRMFLKKTRIAIFISSVILCGSIYLYNTNPLFKYRVEQSSNPITEDSRSLVYGNIILEYLSFDSNQRIFGIGFHGVKSLFISHSGKSIHAHNDYLELLIDTGVIGLSFYVLFIFAFLKYTLKKHDLRNKSVLIFLLVSWLILSFSQANIYTNTSIFNFVLLGFILGNNYKQQLN